MEPLIDSVVPAMVPQIFLNFYPIAIIVSIIVAVIGFTALIMEKNDFQKILIIQLPILAMYFIVSAVGTDLAEALILPGIVVSLAELLAVSEILIFRSITRQEQESEGKVENRYKFDPINMEVLKTAIPITCLVTVLYGSLLTGFTGGAVAGAGILIYLFTGKSKGFSHNFWEEMAGISGVAWCLWILGFLIFFLSPHLWLLSLFMAGGGITIKVAMKLGLLGILGREEYNR